MANERSTPKPAESRSDLRRAWWDQLRLAAGGHTAPSDAFREVLGAVIRESAGAPGLSYIHVVNKYCSKVELWFEDRRDDAATKRRFEWFLARRAVVDAVLPGIRWEQLAHRKGCRISLVVDGGFGLPRSEWPEVHRKLCNLMVRLKAVMSPLIESEQAMSE